MTKAHWTKTAIEDVWEVSYKAAKMYVEATTEGYAVRCCVDGEHAHYLCRTEEDVREQISAICAGIDSVDARKHGGNGALGRILQTAFVV